MEKSDNKVDDEDDDVSEESRINWSNLIFLPFHPVFKLIVLIAVIVKAFMGPIESVYSTFSCTDVMDQNVFLFVINRFYWYVCDVIYFLDTILHIVHRQVIDKAMTREYLPKSAFLLLIDVISLIPIITLTANENCPPMQLWPNILGFVEFFVIYRIVEYFSMVTTHSYWRITVGFTLLLLISLSCISCFLILLTEHGLCRNCQHEIYDWRKYIKFNVKNKRYTNHIYSSLYILSLFIGMDITDIKPSTISEYVLTSTFLIGVHCLKIYIIQPKLFLESLLVQRNIFAFYLRGNKIIAETKRRNPSQIAHIHITEFYNLMWRKRNGIINIPSVLNELPRSLRVDLRQDLVWPLFYHSPTLRKTSDPFQRWLCEFVHLNYKLPGEKFFSGPHCVSNMHYIKSGTVQLISTDDGVTPLLSLTDGTIFGDINFMVPPLTRPICVRCLTYCEVLTLSRLDILKAIQRYSVDRRNIIQCVKDKIKHARTLYTCKQHVRGLDRTEDEGIIWLKRRWWEISDALTAWKKTFDDDQIKCELPPEETVYHCAKYIGQLVLCKDVQLLKKSLFVNVKFPWVLSSESSFTRVWHIIVVLTVYIVLFTYPRVSKEQKLPSWFKFIPYWTNFVYIMDICISALTSIKKDNNIPESFTTVLFTRCKRIEFVLDILATIWIESIAVLLGHPELYNICLMNRLIKVYILFTGEYINQWNIKMDPILIKLCRTVLTILCTTYLIHHIYPTVLEIYIHYLFLSVIFLQSNNTTDDSVDDHHHDDFNNRVGTLIMTKYSMQGIVNFIVFTVSMSVYASAMSSLYLKGRAKTNFQRFVTNLKEYYNSHKIHQDLMRRLDGYLQCQWKYYEGLDIMHPISLKDEPFDIFWKVQGEVAEKIISKSKAFIGADPNLLRELASTAKFLILPESATLLLFGVQSRNVSWLVQGHIKCEYHNEEGELQRTMLNPGDMISVTTSLLKRPSFKTYSCYTDCEIMYINIEDFFNTIKRFPNEWSYLTECQEEFNPLFENIFETYVKKHKEHLKKLRKSIFYGRNEYKIAGDVFVDLDSTWRNPNSNFMYYWMIFRSISVVVSILCAALQGGSGILFRQPLIVVGAVCDCIACIDIVLKLFVAYYDEKGIVIFAKRKCMVNYLTRGFLLDIIGVIPWSPVCALIKAKKISENNMMFINTLSKYSHLYILTCFFNHLADTPSINSIYLLIVKWQVLTILAVVGFSHLFMSYCVEYTFNNFGEVTHMARRNECWMPLYYKKDNKLTDNLLHLTYAESLIFAQGLLLFHNAPAILLIKIGWIIWVLMAIVKLIFVFIACHLLILMMLSYHGSTVFQHGISQLRKFLTAEGVDSSIINNAVAHFSYWWKRTKGINTDDFIGERVGTIFRQDLSYYFYKKTFSSLDTLLKAGDAIQKQLSNIAFQKCFRPNQQIVREMDFMSNLFIVHQGKVVISKEGKQLDVLGKGSIFGPLNSNRPRPIQISVKSDGFADLLEIPLNQFNDIIDDNVKSTISQNIKSENDYMDVEIEVHEDPHSSIEYILRGRKTLRLPWMKQPVEAHKNWHSKSLYIAWFICPSVSTVLVFLLGFVPNDVKENISWSLVILDAIYLVHLISDFYTVELYVVEDRLVKKWVSYRLLKSWGFYADLVSLVVPLVSYIDKIWICHLARLLRLRLFYPFHLHFCMGFKSRVTPILMKSVIILLILHSMICGWIYVACRDSVFPDFVMRHPYNSTQNIDHFEWVRPESRRGGCYTTDIRVDQTSYDENAIHFITPRKWENDYIVAMTFIFIMFTGTDLLIVVPLNVSQIYYKVCIEYLLYLLRLWLTSIAMSTIYTKFRELYSYDYNVNCLTTYLRRSGLSPTLLDSVKKYTGQLWQRQRGNWLPELVHQAPLCLREDLFCALYLHHLTISPLFKNLPEYFTRQVVARFQRIVIFPGKCIVEEGDIHGCIYFIHEGEVEKWYSDQGNDRKMLGLLTANNYFGIVPSFFNTPYRYSYYARTVVDIVYLKFSKWKDLLEAYPNVKEELLLSADKIKREQDKGIYRHTVY